MRAEEFDELIEEPFKVPDLATLWPRILDIHKEMGFSIPLTDKERGTPLSDNDMIEEFQWIYGQYKKYIGTKRSVLLAMKGDLQKMLANISDMIAKQSETPADRPTIVYQTLRNQWLFDTWNHVAWIIENNTRDEDEDV